MTNLIPFSWCIFMSASPIRGPSEALNGTSLVPTTVTDPARDKRQDQSVKLPAKVVLFPPSLTRLPSSGHVGGHLHADERSPDDHHVLPLGGGREGIAVGRRAKDEHVGGGGGSLSRGMLPGLQNPGYLTLRVCVCVCVRKMLTLASILWPG